ncbi:MAG TPA: protein translocase subunit SecD [Candidatus Thiothrix moscowensis]|uniref:protein translocase subunit SecD n=1 Tax=unclassified Thiothrix TaxID=2636184 RepID=UPI0025E6B58F|nr:MULTISPECIES: protein translocase subunit SecD [unclassified Thiothrix]HRJ53894.1 protein translocase subunit SecD [Candidatus Thiothrix moscowensis]HRJ93976.1 protein translocase subunit SecD [Candidatus Thiothrix moscowensis]
MNRYPLWKYLMIAVILLVGVIYSVPNFFPSEPAVQLSPKLDQPIDPATMQRFEQALQAKGLTVRASENNGQQALFRFEDTDTQLKASEALKEAVGSQFVVALNLAPSTPGWLRALNANPMYLGLDLRGGVHFLMEVDMQAATDKAIDRYEDEFRDLLREQDIKYQGIAREGDSIVAKFNDAFARDTAENALRKSYGDSLQFSKPADGNSLQASISQATLVGIQKFAVQQNIITLRKRVNELGVAEPVIQQQGMNRIVVQLPGVQDTARAKEILGATATLEFRLVDEENDPFQAQQNGRPPIGSQLYKERNGNPILLKRKVMLTGDYITDASSGFDQNNRPAVHITLDGKGASRFAKVTGENVQKLMAVVFIETKIDSKEVDGQQVKTSKTTEEVINVARIQEQLSKRFQITGLDSPKESRDLALLLRAGALAAPLYIVEERTVGPSMGKENIEKGFNSNIWGFAAVVVFMLVYYRMFGLTASLALGINGFFLFALLSMLQATLTLPGLAGIALTLGMAIDANVLINERIREELRAGASPQVAINAGYDRAWGTILDSNLTTLIAGIALFLLGSGPIKGFAVVLCLGILTSMFSAVTVSRAIVNLIYGYKPRLQKISI